MLPKCSIGSALLKFSRQLSTTSSWAKFANTVGSLNKIYVKIAEIAGYTPIIIPNLQIKKAKGPVSKCLNQVEEEIEFTKRPTTANYITIPPALNQLKIKICQWITETPHISWMYVDVSKPKVHTDGTESAGACFSDRSAIHFDRHQM
jgi:hypothetical protein